MLFELREVTKTYGHVTALDNLSLEVPEGAIGLLGPNGAGKTTMIRTLLGLIRIDSGGGSVLGLDIRSQRLAIRQAVGFMPEDECLFPGLDGVEFVAYAGKLSGMPRSDAMQRAHEVLNYVRMGEERYRPVEGYSTGMKQKLKLAAALVHDPKLLILDEPTNGLDPKSRVEMVKLARDLAHERTGMSLLLSSHLLGDVEQVCDTIIVLCQGRVMAQGRLEDLKRPEEHIFEVRVKAENERFEAALQAIGLTIQSHLDRILVTLDGDRNARTLWEVARQSGIQIRSLRPLESNLEEIFLRALQSEADDPTNGIPTEPDAVGPRSEESHVAV